MQDIDFLPVEYRQKHVRRQSQPWQIMVVAAFAGLLAIAALAQHRCKQRAEAGLAAMLPQYDLAVCQNNQLATVQKELETARTGAELYTYLHHHWPRTQLLCALLAPLPNEITLQELNITREANQSQAPTLRLSRADKTAEKAELAKLSPTARDLKQLRAESDKMKTVILISGTTSESAALHRYLGKLGDNHLFLKVELDSIDIVEDNRGNSLRFDATLVVRPGYGQPGGPTGPKQEN